MSADANPEITVHAAVERGRAALVDAERRDLELELESRRSAAHRHALWAMLGVSPGAVIPLLASFHEMGMVALAIGVLLVTGVEAWRAIQARMDAAELVQRLRRFGPEEGDP